MCRATESGRQDCHGEASRPNKEADDKHIRLEAGPCRFSLEETRVCPVTMDQTHMLRASETMAEHGLNFKKARNLSVTTTMTFRWKNMLFRGLALSTSQRRLRRKLFQPWDHGYTPGKPY